MNKFSPAELYMSFYSLDLRIDMSEKVAMNKQILTHSKIYDLNLKFNLYFE